MWVRSQDKLELHNIESVWKKFILPSIRGRTISGKNVFLGIYIKRKRCLQVLDEIQEAIDYGIPDKNVDPFMKKVYQMPKE